MKLLRFNNTQPRNWDLLSLHHSLGWHSTLKPMHCTIFSMNRLFCLSAYRLSIHQVIRTMISRQRICSCVAQHPFYIYFCQHYFLILVSISVYLLFAPHIFYPPPRPPFLSLSFLFLLCPFLVALVTLFYSYMVSRYSPVVSLFDDVLTFPA